MDMVRSTLAHRLGVDEARLKGLDLRYPIGPFKRCITYYVPEWTLVFDVPDITFRVTQDVDGDGDEEVIYSEGYFDVRWDAGTIPPVTLVASGLARESQVCEHPPVVCGTVPDIQFGGMMPLTAPYLDNATGYARRPNRPRPLPPPLILPDATAPFCQNVNLFGCLVTAGATKYRLVYKYSSDGGATFSPEVPFANVEWWWHPAGRPSRARGLRLERLVRPAARGADRPGGELPLPVQHRGLRGRPVRDPGADGDRRLQRHVEQQPRPAAHGQLGPAVHAVGPVADRGSDCRGTR